MKALILQNLVLAFSLLTALDTAGAMSTLRNGISSGSTSLTGSTEAGHCIGRCAASAQKSYITQICEQYKQLPGYEDWECVNARIFDDGNERHFVKDLRKKPSSQLNDEEKMILQAADRVGIIKLCGGSNGGNAFLTKHNGRTAVVTSIHYLEDKNGNLESYCQGDALKNNTYMPNTSYYDPARPEHDKGFILRSVELEFPPVNLETALDGKLNSVDKKDYLIFYLKEDIAQDIMPGGHRRGVLKPSSSGSSRGSDLYMLGMSGDRAGGVALNYQSNCLYDVYRHTLNHSCDEVNGSSSSLLGVVENGEITFKGMNNGSYDGGVHPLNTQAPSSWNFGLTSDEILK